MDTLGDALEDGIQAFEQIRAAERKNIAETEIEIFGGL